MDFMNSHGVLLPNNAQPQPPDVAPSGQRHLVNPASWKTNPAQQCLKETHIKHLYRKNHMASPSMASSRSGTKGWLSRATSLATSPKTSKAEARDAIYYIDLARQECHSIDRQP